MLVAGVGLGVAVVALSVSILTGAREDETGMISGLNSTGHEIGGTIGIAIFSTIAAGTTGALAGTQGAAGIQHAFIAAGSSRRSRQPRRVGRPSARAPVRAEVAAEPDRNADPLMTKRTTPAETAAPKRRRADADRSVAAILDAALEALASDPDSSMSEIARRAGVVSGTIYVHFPT